MEFTTRATNLSLIRWLNYGHEYTAKKLAPVVNANYLSQMTTGQMAVDDYTARRIEQAAELPKGWLDRDNKAMIRMATIDAELFGAIADLPDSAKAALLTFIQTSHAAALAHAATPHAEAKA